MLKLFLKIKKKTINHYYRNSIIHPTIYLFNLIYLEQHILSKKNF